MPNGQRRNRNSRHANTQRNLQNASVIEASAIAEIASVVVAAEAFVDNSAEIERLKSRLAASWTSIAKLKKREREALKCADSVMGTMDSLEKEHGLITIKPNRNGSRAEIIPRCLEINGQDVKFKDVPKIFNEKEELIRHAQNVVELQDEEIDKLKTFCKSLITKDKDGIRNMLKTLKEEDDDLVCDINYSDEETDDEESDEEEEDMMTSLKFEGKDYCYTRDFELYDDDLNFIKKFDSKFKMIAHFRPSNKKFRD